MEFIFNRNISIRPSTYMYIDLGYFLKEIEGYCNDNNITWSLDKINPKALFLMGGGYAPSKIFVFNAVSDDLDITNNPLYQKLYKEDKIHLKFGFVKGNGRRIRQKGVDVFIAVEMIKHFHLGNFQRGVLVAGDLDFHPLTSYLVDIGAEMVLLYRKNSTSTDLINSVDRAVELTEEDFRKIIS